MEYDKRSYQKTNDKKVLHKIRKHWVVVSTALLMALGGGAAATHVSANADTTNANNGSNASSTNTIKERLNQQLQTPQKQQNTNRQASINNNNNGENNNQNNNSQNESIINEAKVLHSRIVSNAGQNISNQQQTNNNTAQSDAAGQGRVAANAPKVNNNGVHVNKPGNGISDIAKRISANENNGVANANANNNQVDVNRQGRRLLGGDAPEPASNYEVPNSTDANKMFSLQKDGNGTLYSTGYQFTDAMYLNSDKYDTNPSDYGAVTVDYVDPSDGNLTVDNMTISDKADGTPFSDSYFLKNYPTAGNNAPYGYSLEKDNTQLKDGRTVNQIDSGNNISKFVGGENQYLVINLHRNAQPASNGNVLVQYLNESDNDKVLSYRMNSNSDGKNFDQQGFINDIPEGYTFDKWRTVQNGIENGSDQSPITKYTNNVQTLNVYVKSTDNSRNLTVNYYNNKSGAYISSKTITGNQGTTVNYDPLNEFVPQSYKYSHDGTNNPHTFTKNMPDAAIYVDPDSTKSGDSNNAQDVINKKTHQNITDGTITIHYINSKTLSDVATRAVAGPSGKGIPMSDYKKRLPAGWSSDTSKNHQEDIQTTVSDGNGNQTPQYVVPTIKIPSNGQNKNFNIYVDNYNSKGLSQTVTATVRYMNYNPTTKKTSDLPTTTSDPTGGVTKITGKRGSKIDYTPYREFVPQGYQYLRDGNLDYNLEPNDTNTIIVTSNNDLTQPLNVHYFNQNGSDVTPKTNSKEITGQPYGTKLTNKHIGSDTSLDNTTPSGYTIKPSDQNATYTIDSDAQTDNIMVQGSDQNPSHSKNPNDPNALVVKVNQRIVDAQGNVISNNVVSDSAVSGKTGSDLIIDPRNYMPAPNSDYTMDPDDKTDEYQIGYHKLTPMVNENHNAATDFQQNSQHPNEVDATFTYTQNNAVASVTYEDASDGNNIVGSSVVNGKPNTKMSDYYGTASNKNAILAHLNSDTPYGYTYKIDDKGNPSDLINGANYIIYVSNAHLQPKPTVQPRTGYGYITINYGTNLGTDPTTGHTTGTILSTVTTTNPLNSDFSPVSADTTTNNGGYMPDVYANDQPSVTSSDARIRKYTSNPQVYNVNLNNYTKPTTTQQVSDSINYEVLTPSDNEDTAATQKLSDEKLSPVYIKGTDGSYINYAPYTNNLPNGYYYDGLATNSTVYTTMQNGTPIATVYLKKAGENSNACANYIPKNDNDHQGSNGQNVNPSDTDVHPSDGYYWPSDNAPVTAQNPNQPIKPSNDPNYKFDGTMPTNYEGDNKGDVPNGYVPAWVQNKKTGKYEPGYVPSDIIPSDYMPGYVPNGHGGYVPGYVPSKSSDMPSGKNGGKTIPSYVPGNIPSGTKGKTVPGYVPNMAPYSHADGTFDIEYVENNDHNAVISDVTATGQVGNPLSLNKGQNGQQYINDVPVGYIDPTDVGEVQSDGSVNKTSNDTYNYVDGTHTIKIGLSKLVSGNVIYVNANNGYQVGSTQISGAEGSQVNFNKGGNDYQYEQLLPYGYDAPTPEASNKPTLQNGADYIIKVNHENMGPVRPPQQQKGYGQMIVNYVNDKNGQVIGTDSFIGKSGSSLTPPDNTRIDMPDNQDGYIPYGFQVGNNTYNDAGKVQNAQFSSDKNNNPEIYDIRVTPNTNEKPDQTPTYTDKIAYQVVTKDGDKTLDYNKDHNGVTLAGSGNSDSGIPVSFDVTGKAGTDINYQPYQTDVPAGYEPDGMGNHSAVIDKGHDGTGNAYDWLLLRQSPKTMSLGTIKLNYVDSTHNAQNPITSITLNGITGNDFNLGYYEDNLPTSIGSDVFVSADNNPLNFSNGNQTVNITVKKPQQQQASYSNVHVYFVKADANPTASNFRDKLVPGSQSETMTGRVGDIFTPYAYEYNVPANTSFDHIVSGQNIDSFASNDQNLVIAVNTTNGSF